MLKEELGCKKEQQNSCLVFKIMFKSSYTGKTLVIEKLAIR